MRTPPVSLLSTVTALEWIGFRSPPHFPCIFTLISFHFYFIFCRECMFQEYRATVLLAASFPVRCRMADREVKNEKGQLLPWSDLRTAVEFLVIPKLTFRFDFYFFICVTHIWRSVLVFETREICSDISILSYLFRILVLFRNFFPCSVSLSLFSFSLSL